jgi:hypothetical protein
LFTFFNAIREIDNKTESHPNNKAEPGVERQGSHLNKANQCTENRYSRYKRDFERTHNVRSGFTQNEDTNTNDNKGKESSD